jgi:hypothetical protein
MSPTKKQPASRQTHSKGSRLGCLPALFVGLSSIVGGLIIWLSHGHNRAAQVEAESVIPASREAGHEVRDLNLRTALISLGVLLVGIGIVVLMTAGFEYLLVGHPPTLIATIANPPNATPPPAPRLESGNGEVLQEIHAAEDPLLNNYTWIDQKAGTVRIPIDRAIELTGQRGLPTRPQNERPQQTANSGLTRPASSSSGRTQEAILP